MRKLSFRKLRNKFKVTLRVKGVAGSWMLTPDFQTLYSALQFRGRTPRLALCLLRLTAVGLLQ